MIQFSSSPKTERISRTENCPATSMVKVMLMMSTPSPFCAPTNSATIAPINASTIAISNPAMMNGIAVGTRSMDRICSSEASRERMSATRSSSAERRPAIVFTMSGKKAVTAACATFEVSPSPNQTMMSGARATFGIDWNITMKGYRKYSTRWLRAMSVPRTSARMDPKTKPSNVSATVTRR